MKRLVAVSGWSAFVVSAALLVICQRGERHAASPSEGGSPAPSSVDTPLVQPPAGGAFADLGPPPGERVRVEVLNAGGVQGLASEATDYLRELGFDVVSFGNADEFTEEATRVLDRVAAPALARAVADALGVESVTSSPDPDLYVDVSVMLGREWERPIVQPAREAARRSNPGRQFR